MLSGSVTRLFVERLGINVNFLMVLPMPHSQPFAKIASTAHVPALLAVVLLAVVSVPILIWPFAPVMDLPNHMARIWLESQPVLTGIHARAYIVDWSNTSSNYLTDLVGVALLAFHSLRVLATGLLWLAIVGPALGVIALSRVLHGRFSIYACLPLAAIWGQSVASGFVAFSLSLAVALAMLLLDHGVLRHRVWWLAGLGQGLSLLLIYICHPFGLVLYGAIDMALAYGPQVRPSRPTLLASGAGLARAYVLPAMVLLAYGALHAGSNPMGRNFVMYGAFQSHVVSLISPFIAYNEPFEILLSLPVGIALAYALIRGEVVLHGGLLVATAGLWLCALVIPDSLGDGAWLTRRLPLMAVFTLSLALRPRGADGPLVTGLLVTAILAHAVWIGWVWSHREGDYRDLATLARAIPADSTVIVARNPGLPRRWSEPGTYIRSNQYVRRHLPALLVPLAHAYVPTLFALRGQQPLRIAPAFQRLSVPSSSIPTIDDLRHHASLEGNDIYLAAWECDFDMLLILEQDREGRQDEAFPHAHPVAATATARLYRLEKPGTCRAAIAR